MKLSAPGGHHQNKLFVLHFQVASRLYNEYLADRKRTWVLGIQADIFGLLETWTWHNSQKIRVSFSTGPKDNRTITLLTKGLLLLSLLSTTYLRLPPNTSPLPTQRPTLLYSTLPSRYSTLPYPTLLYSTSQLYYTTQPYSTLPYTTRVYGLTSNRIYSNSNYILYLLLYWTLNDQSNDHQLITVCGNRQGPKR